jgi:hypothetical protein
MGRARAGVNGEGPVRRPDVSAAAGSLYRQSRMMRRVAVLALVPVVAACSGPHTGHGGGRSIGRSEVVKIQVGSLPESPVGDRSAARPHWAEIVATLPALLPEPTHRSCSSGPTLVVLLHDGEEVDYQCSLPSMIKTTRDYILSLTS